MPKINNILTQVPPHLNPLLEGEEVLTLKGIERNIFFNLQANVIKLRTLGFSTD